MPKMYLMCGNPGSGKTTYAKKFAEENGIRYLGIDRFFDAFNGSCKDRSNKNEVWLHFFEAIMASMKDGVDIIVDANAPNKYLRHDYCDWFPNYDIHLIWVKAGAELCQKNNRNRDRVIPESDMTKLIHKFCPPDVYGEEANWYKSYRIIHNYENTFKEEVVFEEEKEV